MCVCKGVKCKHVKYVELITEHTKQKELQTKPGILVCLHDNLSGIIKCVNIYNVSLGVCRFPLL